MNQPKEGFEVLAELTNRYWRTLEMHADTAAALGTGALLPAVTLPQAQLDIQHAIRDAFHAGAAFQAALQPIVMSVDQSMIFTNDTEPKVIIERIPQLKATLYPDDAQLQALIHAPRPRLDPATFAPALPRRDPAAYYHLFAEGRPVLCPTCHQETPTFPVPVSAPAGAPGPGEAGARS